MRTALADSPLSWTPSALPIRTAASDRAGWTKVRTASLSLPTRSDPTSTCGGPVAAASRCPTDTSRAPPRPPHEPASAVLSGTPSGRGRDLSVAERVIARSAADSSVSAVGDQLQLNVVGISEDDNKRAFERVRGCCRGVVHTVAAQPALPRAKLVGIVHRERHVIEADPSFLEAIRPGGSVLAEAEPDGEPVMTHEHLASRSVGARVVPDAAEAENCGVPVCADVDVRDGEAEMVDPVDRHGCRLQV